MTVVGLFISLCVGVSALIGHLYNVLIWLGFLSPPFKDRLAIEDRLYSLYDRRDKLNDPNVEGEPPGFRSNWERLTDIQELIQECGDRREDGRFGAWKRSGRAIKKGAKDWASGCGQWCRRRKTSWDTMRRERQENQDVELGRLRAHGEPLTALPRAHDARRGRRAHGE